MPIVLLLAAGTVALLVLVGTFSALPSGIGALRLPTATSEPTATATPVPTATTTPVPTPLPAGYQLLPADVSNASFALRPDPAQAATALHLAAGRAVQLSGERQGERCRVVLLDDDADEANNAHVWLDCATVGVQ